MRRGFEPLRTHSAAHIPGSSSGRTLGSGPRNAGSNPAPGSAEANGFSFADAHAHGLVLGVDGVVCPESLGHLFVENLAPSGGELGRGLPEVPPRSVHGIVMSRHMTVNP